MTNHVPVPTQALVIGTGFAGLAAAIALKEELGLQFIVLEKAADIGGTWWYNTYPGAACDIPSHMYSYSFFQKPDWTRMWASQEEILEYMRTVVGHYELLPHIRFNQCVERAVWSDEECCWHVFTSDGTEYVTQFLISGAGPLHVPLVPDFEGLSQFQGALFHSAEWNHEVDLTGLRVALIGTGASAIQIGPEIAAQVKSVHVFQRTPPWVMPRANWAFPPSVQWAFAHVPGLRELWRLAIYWTHEAIGYGMTRHPALLKFGELLVHWHIRRSITDPALRRQLTPKYKLGCKRILNSGTWYRFLNLRQVKVVSEGIKRFTPKGIVTIDDVEHEFDVIICATGFHVTTSYRSLPFVGQHGKDLVALWDSEGPQALRGVNVAGFPNLSILLGPNTGLGHNSVIFMIQSQVGYIARLITETLTRGAQAFVPTRSAQDRWNEQLQKDLEHSVWVRGGCQSWYVDHTGHIRALWSGMSWLYWWALRRLKPKEYEFLG